VNDVDLNRRFVETDDEEVADLLFSQIFKAYYKTVCDKIDRMRWNHPDTVVDPDEITSDAFIKAFNKRKQIGEPEKLVEWLVTVAKNLMIDKIRKARAQARRISVVSLGSLSFSESSTDYATSLAETDAEQAQADQDRIEQILQLLDGKDREIVTLMLDRLSPKEIAVTINSTPGAVQKRWERLRQWLEPIVYNLDTLVDCLSEVKDRKIMERYLDGQPLSEITKALGISCATVEETVKRVIADWKKAVRQNPMDPVSAMANEMR